MSLATRQAVLILSMVHGGVKLMIREEDLPASVSATAHWLDSFLEEAVDRYPTTGDHLKNIKWMKSKLKQWDEIGADKMIRWHPLVTATLCLNFIEDLLDKINNQARTDLEAIRDALIRISYHYTEAGEDKDLYQYFDEASAMAEELYLVTGFSR